MSNKSDRMPRAAANEIIITRIINAPRERVWEAMTDPKQVVHWWGPNGFTTTIKKMDVREGGEWKHTMRGPDGAEYPNKSIFTEVKKPERIVYKHGGGIRNGRGHSFTAYWIFEEQGPSGKTKLTLRMVFPTPEDRDLIIKGYNAIKGGQETLARLDQYLVNAPVIIERLYRAPFNIF
jgi:uncharacterized protein YndB with AHSA1/START domain